MKPAVLIGVIVALLMIGDVSLNHGHGTDAIRQAVQNFLAKPID